MPTRLLLDGPDIESLLARVQDEHGDAARIVHAEKVRTGGLGGFFARERYEVSVEVPDLSAPGTTSPSDPGPLLDEGTPAALLLADTVEDSQGTFGDPAPPVGPATPAVSTSTPAFTEVLESIRAGMGSSPAPVLAPARPVGPSGSTAAATVVPLQRGGRKVPRAPRTAGAIVVLVGEAAVAYGIAVELASSMRLDPAGIYVAAPAPVVKVPAARRIADPVTARVKAAKMLTAPTASIVVVDLPIGCDPEWSADVIDGLGAAAVWAVVDATRKIADLHRWTAGLRRIDALAVHHAGASEDPSSVRALGIPVALLDGRSATAAAWRAVGSEPPDGLA